MRRLLTLTFLFVSLITFSQDQVNWEFNYVDGNVEASASIAEGWHLYSQHINNEIGPIPTSFEFEENENIQLIGKTQEPESLKEYDENFEGELNFFKESVTFTQEVKVKGKAELKGFVTYMICNDTMCLPPTDENFTITIE